MNELLILVVENGFHVTGNTRGSGMIGRAWAFESAESLSCFIKKWGEENTKTTTEIGSRNETKS